MERKPSILQSIRTAKEAPETWEDSDGFMFPSPPESPVESSVPIPDDQIQRVKASDVGRICLIEGTWGKVGNWEVVGVARNGRLFHICLVRDEPSNRSWTRPAWVGNFLPAFSGLSMIQSNTAKPGNLEVAIILDGALYHFWRNGPHAWQFESCIWLPRKCRGNPALIQGTYGKPGNFELVVPCVDRGLLHIPRLMADGGHWGNVTWFGHRLQQVSAVTMIQSNYGTPGNFEVVCVANGQLYSFCRDNSTDPQHWQGPRPIHPHIRVTGNPVLVQGHAFTKGNFELVVPSADGGLIHLWRNNDLVVPVWSQPTYFARDLGVILDVSMIELSHSNMEVVCMAGWGIYHISCRDGEWTKPSMIIDPTWQLKNCGVDR